MAPIGLTAGEHTAAMEKGGADIRYMFGKEEVPATLQGIFYHIGITSISKLASFASDVADLKKVMLEDFGLDGTATIRDRVALGAVNVSWTKSVARASEQAKIDGELDAKRIAKPLPSSDCVAMRRSFEAKWWPLTEKWVPGRTYLEKRSDELEQGDMKAERLSEVICRDEDNNELMIPIWDQTGNLRVRKTGATVPEPINSEQLRYRITLMGTALMFLAARTDRLYLQGLTPQLFSTYLEYLLGDFVWNLVAQTPEGYSVGAPAWAQIVSYDYQIRKKAFIDMNNTGTPWLLCFERAWLCPVTKE